MCLSGSDMYVAAGPHGGFHKCTYIRTYVRNVSAMGRFSDHLCVTHIPYRMNVTYDQLKCRDFVIGLCLHAYVRTHVRTAR